MAADDDPVADATETIASAATAAAVGDDVAAVVTC